jgi:hypothetical protein
MEATAVDILAKLPPDKDQWVKIKDTQYVPDIITEICTAQRLYGAYYDQFSYMFLADTTEEIAEKLYWFCKENITYREETVDFQSSAVPQGILSRGYGDCKHYALFCGGVLGSLNRMFNCRIPWEFFFAGYNGAKEPYHVFVTIQEPGIELWLDPTPGSGGTPSVHIKKKVNG